MALINQIEKLRAKPHHVRERIAFGTAAGVTGVVGLIWIVTLAATGTFSLAPSGGTLAGGNPSDAASAQNSIAQTQNGFSQLVGSAGAAFGATSSAPALRIVDDGTKSSLETKQANATNNSNATVIPF